MMLAPAPATEISWDVIQRVTELLECIEELPFDATGVIRFSNGAGMILIESKTVCWAAAKGQERRLTETLRYQRNPPLDQKFIEKVCAKSKATDTPIGEALLATGAISREGLRAALLEQTSDALVAIARCGAESKGFTQYVRPRYNAQFSFASSEILAAVCSKSNRGGAMATTIALRDILVPDSSGFAFVCSGAASRAIPVAVVGANIRVSLLCELGKWTVDLFALAGSVNSSINVASASWHGCALVAWRARTSHFAAVCKNQAASARLLAKLAPPLSKAQMQ